MCKLSLNQNLTYRWNPSTDYFEYFYNGSWHNDKKANILFDGHLYDNGTFTTSYKTGYYATNIGISPVAFNIAQSYIGVPFPTSGHGSFVFDEPIDFTTYNTVTVKTSSTDMVINVSGIYTSGYICFSSFSYGGNYIELHISSSKENFENTNNQLTTAVSRNDVAYITEVIIE